MSKQPPPAPTASAIGSCPTIVQIVGRLGTGTLPRTIASPDQPLLIWVRVGQGPTALAVGAGGGCLDIFFLSSIISLFCLPLSGRRPDRLKNCLKGPLSPKQPTNQPYSN